MLSSAFNHPLLRHTPARICLGAVIALRCLFFLLTIFVLDYVIGLGSSPYVLSLSATLGVVVGSLVRYTRLRLSGVVLALVAVYLAFRLIAGLIGLMPTSSANSIFWSYNLLTHGGLNFLFFCLAALSSWFFWSWLHTITLELLAVSSVIIYFLSGHRGFHLDTPRMINTLAWHFGVSTLSMFVLIGSLSVAVLLLYLFIATLPASPRLMPGKQQARFHPTSPRILGSCLVVGLVIGVVTLVSSQVHSHYDQIVLTRTANGVGQEDEAGLSPLGFHSALGSTNQPAALVRLEGDYAENPYSPMLYLRENALSRLTTRELVRADARFDRDISFGKPGEGFIGQEDPSLVSRVPLIQSIYTLTKHERAFAVDYPASIVRLKNPAPERFKSTFKAYSIAPGFSSSELDTSRPGDPRWSDEERKLYLETHTDGRYGELARKIAGNIENPHRKVLAVTNYLVKNAIYTLAPGHEVEPDADPVEPFLFGDLRGYCVHFAHATTYMLRALNIPARIATGYLTDLSQSRDGHILLRMSDRHAWAEAYFEGKGWIPFDTQPEQVESHADTQVDSKLLEELMGMLGPEEEILSDDLLEDEQNVFEPDRYFIPGRREVLIVLALIVLVLLSIKLYLRYSWLLPSSIPVHLKRSYRALCSYLYDLGYPRYFGETRSEYRRRIVSQLQLETLGCTDRLLRTIYASDGIDALSTREVGELRCKDFKALRKMPIWKRIWAALNPMSALSIVGGSRW